jgi:hypothetical protein
MGRTIKAAKEDAVSSLSAGAENRKIIKVILITEIKIEFGNQMEELD